MVLTHKRTWYMYACVHSRYFGAQTERVISSLVSCFPATNHVCSTTAAGGAAGSTSTAPGRAKKAECTPGYARSGALCPAATRVQAACLIPYKAKGLSYYVLDTLPWRPQSDAKAIDSNRRNLLHKCSKLRRLADRMLVASCGRQTSL